MPTILTYEEAFYSLWNSLQPLYDSREAAAIAHKALEHITGHNKLERITYKDRKLTETQQQYFDDAQIGLSGGKPLQHITGQQWFMGNVFKVNEHVLIPRPETEELVDWIIAEWKDKKKPLHILDIGTGSGCIAISLKLAVPDATVTAVDISAAAISIANENAQKLGAAIVIQELDFLDQTSWVKLNNFDIIVSNPPYIPFTAREELHVNVKEYEPALALFVPEHDPLLFYKAISDFGRQHLAKDGAIYCELHHDNATEAERLFAEIGYENVQLRKDMNGSWRMLKANSLR